jgi:hypothetical protein
MPAAHQIRLQMNDAACVQRNPDRPLGDLGRLVTPVTGLTGARRHYPEAWKISH